MATIAEPTQPETGILRVERSRRSYVEADSWRPPIRFGYGLQRAEVVGSRIKDSQIREDYLVVAELIAKGTHSQTFALFPYRRGRAFAWFVSRGVLRAVPTLPGWNKPRITIIEHHLFTARAFPARTSRQEG